MDQDTQPAPFNVGDHLRYIGKTTRTLPAARPSGAELVLTPGLVGVVILSTGALAEPNSPLPWHIQVQFDNGFQLDVTPENAADFEMAHGEGSPTVGQS